MGLIKRHYRLGENAAFVGKIYSLNSSGFWAT